MADTIGPRRKEHVNDDILLETFLDPSYEGMLAIFSPIATFAGFRFSTGLIYVLLRILGYA